MATSTKVWFAATSIIIVAVCLWESLVCWNAMIGCQQPWIVGFTQWLSLFLGLLSGPFSPYYLAAVLDDMYSRWTFLLGYSGTLLPLFISPYLYFVLRGKKSVGALVAGMILWLLAGHLFCIAVWV